MTQPPTQALSGVIYSLLDVYRQASARDLLTSPEDVVALLDTFILLWINASSRNAVAPADRDDIALTMQPPDADAPVDPLVAARMIRGAMIGLLSVTPPPSPTPFSLRYGNLSGAAHRVMRAIHLLYVRYDDGSFDRLLAPFLPQLASFILINREPAKCA